MGCTSYIPRIFEKLLITSRTLFTNLLINLFFVMQRDVLLMYHEFHYKLHKSTLIVCTRMLTWRKKGKTRYAV